MYDLISETSIYHNFKVSYLLEKVGTKWNRFIKIFLEIAIHVINVTLSVIPLVLYKYARAIYLSGREYYINHQKKKSIVTDTLVFDDEM